MRAITDYFDHFNSYHLIEHFKNHTSSLKTSRPLTLNEGIKKAQQTVSWPFFSLAAVFATIDRRVRDRTSYSKVVSTVVFFAPAALLHLLGKTVSKTIKIFRLCLKPEKKTYREQWEGAFTLSYEINTKFGSIEEVFLKAFQKHPKTTPIPHIVFYAPANADSLFTSDGYYSAGTSGKKLFEQPQKTILMIHVAVDKFKNSRWQNCGFDPHKIFENCSPLFPKFAADQYNHVMRYEEFQNLLHYQVIPPNLKKLLGINP